jgi:hypothetical protein
MVNDDKAIPLVWMRVQKVSDPDVQNKCCKLG